MSESKEEDESLATSAHFHETPHWSDNAQVAAVTNTLTYLTLAGVLVVNTAVEAVVQSLRHIVTVAIGSLGAEVEFTSRPRNIRSRIVKTTCPMRIQHVSQFPITSSFGSASGSS